jgi:dTDP-4-amino-4,6-dideoxygalactose transaminase
LPAEPRIAFVDLGAQYRDIEADVVAAIQDVLRSRAFVQGPFVAAFEQAFCASQGVSHAVGCSNGTAALEIAMRSLDIGPGDEVVTVAHTFFATVEAILNVGATPVFVDIEPRGYGMNAAAAAAAMTPRTKAILPVHLYGSPCDMGALCQLAEEHGLLLIEDAAQAHLATYRNRSIGTFGHAATFSFYPSKNLGAYGDAGLIVTRDAETAGRARRLLDHGRSSKYEHDVVGSNCRMDGLQAAILSVKIRHLEKWTDQRRRLAAIYDDRLRRTGFKVVEPPGGANAVYHLYVVEVANRNAVMEHMASNGVQVGIHYPVPLHRQPALADLRCARTELPVTDRVAGRVLSLPMYAELPPEQVHEVCDLFLAVARP